MSFRRRKRLLRDIGRNRDSVSLLYVTGDRPGWETQVSSDAVEFFIDHLDRIGQTRKISLILYTRGGDALAAWNIVNLLRQFCDEFELIVPRKALSAGTLIALGHELIKGIPTGIEM